MNRQWDGGEELCQPGGQAQEHTCQRTHLHGVARAGLGTKRREWGGLAGWGSLSSTLSKPAAPPLPLPMLACHAPWLPHSWRGLAFGVGGICLPQRSMHWTTPHFRADQGPSQPRQSHNAASSTLCSTHGQRAVHARAIFSLGCTSVKSRAVGICSVLCPGSRHAASTGGQSLGIWVVM